MPTSRGIGLEQVAAVGDAANDIEMLWCAGRLAAMRSASLEVRVGADLVVPPCGDDGLLDAFAWCFPDLAAYAATPGGRGRPTVP